MGVGDEEAGITRGEVARFKVKESFDGDSDCSASTESLLPQGGEGGLMKVEDLKVAHYWRLSTIMGMSDILLDMDKYFMYLLLIRVHGCDFQSYYGALYMLYTLCYLGWSPLTGLWSDLLHRHILLVMVLCSGSLLSLYMVMVFVPMSKTTMAVVYFMRCIVHMQLSSACWKAIKLFVQRMFGTNFLVHEQVMNRIGTLGDLSTEMFEIALLLMALACGLYFEEYRLVAWILNGGVLFIAGTCFILSLSLLASDRHIILSAPAERPPGSPFHFLGVTDRVASEQKSGVVEGVRALWEFLRSRVAYFLSSRVLTNCVMLSMVSSCFEYMFDGPVALTRATLTKGDHGLCHGMVDFILIQTVILQLMYLAGGAVYFTFIMHLHPAKYYGYVYPAASVLFIAGTFLQYFNLPELVSAVVISLVTVLAYYVSIYNSYVLSGAAKAEYFGFVQALYSLAVGAAGFVPSFLQLVQAQQSVLLTVALFMALWGMLQSANLWRHRREFAGSTEKCEPLS